MTEGYQLVDVAIFYLLYYWYLFGVKVHWIYYWQAKDDLKGGGRCYDMVWLIFYVLFHFEGSVSYEMTRCWEILNLSASDRIFSHSYTPFHT